MDVKKFAQDWYATWDAYAADRPAIRGLERLVVARVATESHATGPWCVDVTWQTEVLPVLTVLVLEETEREWVAAVLLWHMATVANCRGCGFQHSAAWEKELAE